MRIKSKQRKPFGNLTPREKKLCELAIKHPDWRNDKLALKAGYNAKKKNVLGNITTQVLAKPHSRNYVDALMEHTKGLDRPTLLRKVKEGTDAMQSHFFADGLVEKKSVDYPTRKQYLELAFRLRGDLKLAEEDMKQVNNILVNLTDAALVQFITGKITVDELIGGNSGNNEHEGIPAQ